MELGNDLGNGLFEKHRKSAASQTQTLVLRIEQGKL
jgi:hypothetical protein